MVVTLLYWQNADSRTLAERAVNTSCLAIDFKASRIEIHVSIFAIA